MNVIQRRQDYLRDGGRDERCLLRSPVLVGAGAVIIPLRRRRRANLSKRSNAAAGR